jgi:hypothetical protein
MDIRDDRKSMVSYSMVSSWRSEAKHCELFSLAWARHGLLGKPYTTAPHCTPALFRASDPIVRPFSLHYTRSSLVLFFCCCCCCLFFFFAVLGLNSGPTPQDTQPAFFFCDGFFWDRVSWTICFGWLQTMILLISASWVARIIGMSHQLLASSILK